MSIRLSLGTLFLTLAVVAAGCSMPAARNGLPIENNLPPAQMLMQPGPGVGGPGPGVIPPMSPPGMAPMPAPTVQVWFTDPESCEVKWDVNQPGAYDSSPYVVPFKQSFVQGGVYRLRVSNIEGFEDKTYYPSLEIGPITPRTSAFIAHSAIPIQLTNEDFTQVKTGNFVTKVIYIPDPEFQELAIAGIDTLVSTRLDPGVDPIVEADRRGSILAIVRMGNKDLESAASGDVKQAGYFDPYGAYDARSKDVRTRSYDARTICRLTGTLPSGHVSKLRFGCNGSVLWHANDCNAYWFAWTAAHSIGNPCGIAEANDAQPHQNADTPANEAS